jgi:hypothetical protein
MHTSSSLGYPRGTASGRKKEKLTSLPIAYYQDGVVRPLKVIPFNNENNIRLAQVGYWCRGFERRHWRKLLTNMLSQQYPQQFVENIKQSWLSFKLLATCYKSSQKDLVWIFKNFLSVEDQKFYKDIKDSFFDKDFYSPLEKGIVDLYIKEGTWPRIRRLMDYFRNTPSAFIAPMSCFPLVDPNKSEKMPLCMVPLDVTPELMTEFRNVFHDYILKLGVESIKFYPPDVLDKVGNQKYNDGGIPRHDFEKPQVSFDSSFLYQKFIAQPHQMREVWLPGKAIKINNSFWMSICRQFLVKDLRYPDPDVAITYDRIKDRLTMPVYRFDISGFGFQYPRWILESAASVLCELYPMSLMDENFTIMTEIFKNITVQKDLEFIKPIRGIGLGYYEDLKTLAMLAILDKYDPISLYGDQGLLDLWQGEAIGELQRFGFIVEFDKVECIGTTPYPTMKWAGASMSQAHLDTSRRFFDNLRGAFFSRFHWERKLALRSISRSFPDYRRVQKKLFYLYENFFGYEFYPKDSLGHFDNCGLSMYNYTSGYSKLYKVQRLVAPFDPILFSLQYLTPFKAATRKIYPWSLAKEFQIKRKTVYRATPYGDCTPYDYCYPRVRMANETIERRLDILPAWADMLYIARYGKSSGSFTFGLSPPGLKDAYLKYPLSTLPARCAVSGGYRVLTRFAAPGIPTAEAVEECELLAELTSVEGSRIRRADLLQDPIWSEDLLYRDSNLLGPFIGQKRKSPPTLNSSLFDSNDVRDALVGNLSRKMAHGEVLRVSDLLQFSSLNQALVNQDMETNSSLSFGDELDINLDTCIEDVLIDFE